MIEKHLKADIHAISAESKSRLAKLLATEDISIEHRADATTAAFDLKDRILILPNWTGISEDIYDLLVMHEDGHALFTPLAGWHGAVSDKTKGPNFKGFLNVIEDARIEKKMKRKFPGGRKAFTQGYKELLDRDFFGLNGRDVNSFGLIDRINMHFKGGVAMGVKFTDEEQPFVDRTAAAESWADVESIASDLWDLMKDQMAETDSSDDVNYGPSSDEPSDEEGEMGEGFEPSDDDESDEDSDGSSSSDDEDGDNTSDDSSDSDGDGDDTEDGEGSGSDSDESEDEAEAGSADTDADSSDKDDSDSDPTSGDGKADETGSGRNTDGSDGRTQGDPWSETDAAQRKNEEKLVNTDASHEDPLYAQIPKDAAFDLDTIIIPHAKIFAAQLRSLEKYKMSSLDDAKKALASFRRDNGKVINYLVKEFEMRKAADSHRRSTTARSGTLDMAKIHSYKWNDDLFKKITDVADGKNHGLVMFVDWSGSMSSNMEDTLGQILNLVLFCKKVNIPFDVYGFSDSADKGLWSENGRVCKDRMHENHLETGDATFRREYFNLLHLAGSKGTKSDFQNMLLSLIMLRGGFGHGYSRGASVSFPVPSWVGLGGTPLSEAVITAIPIVNKFRADNRVQIVNTVFLTDGCGGNLNSYHNSDASRNRYGGPARVILRERKSHKEFVIDHGRGQFPALLEIVRLRTGSKVVNMYVTSPKASGFKYAYKNAHTDRNDWQTVETEANAAWKEAKKEGGFTIEDSPEGWDQHYMILGNEDEVEERLGDELVGAKKSDISRAFRSTSKGKLRNRVVLRKFTELISS